VRLNGDSTGGNDDDDYDYDDSRGAR